MGISSVAIKGAKTVGKYSLKGFEKGGKFIGKNAIQMLGNAIKSKPAKTIAGIGLTIGTMYLFGPAIITAKLYKDLVIDNCIFGHKKSVIESIKSSVEMTKDTLQKAIVEPTLDTLGDAVKFTGEQIFDKDGGR